MARNAPAIPAPPALTRDIHGRELWWQHTTIGKQQHDKIRPGHLCHACGKKTTWILCSTCERTASLRRVGSLVTQNNKRGIHLTSEETEHVISAVNGSRLRVDIRDWTARSFCNPPAEPENLFDLLETA